MQIVDGRGPEEQLLAQSAEPAPHANPLLLVHRLMRGRYVWAAVLAAALGAPLAWLGYQSQKPMFVSEGVVRIAPTQRQILFQTEDNEAIPFFDQYVGSQAELIRNQDLLADVMEDPAANLANVGWPAGSRGIVALVRATSVRVPPRSGMIYVSVSHPSPDAAHAACDAILRLYHQRHERDAKAAAESTVNVLVRREGDKVSERDLARGNIRLIAERHGTEDIQPIIDSLNREVTALDIEVERILAELNSLESSEDGGGSGTDEAPSPTPTERVGQGGPSASAGPAQAPPKPVESLSLEELAARDPDLSALLNRRDQLRAEIEAFTAQFSARHLEVQNRQATLATVERLIALRSDIVRRNWGDDGAAALARIAELRGRLGRAQAQREALMKRVRELARDLSDIQGFRDQADRAEAERLEAVRRREELRTEQNVERVGRAEVFAASTPLFPSSDKRMMMAGAGGLGGAGLGFVLVALLGFARGGFRFIDEFDGATGSLLVGVVPDLGARREPTAEAALCIHHARALLDRRVPAQRERGRIIAVTSPTAGDGKTTVCCSLATSFAMAGFRTVVVDADFVGRGMTSRLDMDRVAGLSDALSGGGLEESLTPGGAENLTILSAGREEALGADRLSATNLGPLLDRLARAHDVVLVDSGPVLGSIEATVTVGLADAVLAIVSRGQSTQMFAAMRRKLQSLGTDLSGVIFNRAYPKDFAHSTHTSVVSAQSQRSRSVQVPDFVTMGRDGVSRATPAPNERAGAGAGSA